mmetsp:Transcript_98596/g.220687  ORF Transcript_98596/g.220687 Transcript_98596/m.220687 type:complete len:92 (+) Transcript_98596:150-425(+)
MERRAASGAASSQQWHHRQPIRPQHPQRAVPAPLRHPLGQAAATHRPMAGLPSRIDILRQDVDRVQADLASIKQENTMESRKNNGYLSRLE